MKLELTEVEKELMQHCLGLANIMCMKAGDRELTEGQTERIAEAAAAAIQWICDFDESVMASLFKKLFGEVSPEQNIIIENMQKKFESL